VEELMVELMVELMGEWISMKLFDSKEANLSLEIYEI